MIEFLQPTVNLGTLKTDGVDYGLQVQPEHECAG